MPDGLYEHGALAGAEQQADLLRRLAASGRLNATVDWPNVIGEVQDVGLLSCGRPQRRYTSDARS